MSSITTSDGMRIAYYVDDFSDPWKRGRNLLLLHSAMGSARRFYSMVPGLARDYRVLRMDLRGHGNSQVPLENVPFDLQRLVDDALELLDYLKIDKVHIVGNSAGGYVTQQLAIQHPERVLSICLFGSTPGLKQSAAASWIPQVEAKGLRTFLAETISDRFPADQVDPRLIDWFLDEAAKNDPAFIKRFILHMTTVDFMDDIGRIKCPTLIVGPGAEPIGHAGAYEEMSKRIAGAELVYYENARHNVCDYLPERCVSDVLGFLGRHFPQTS